ncbi:MAG: non-ribosomal peptide synthetase [Bacteroidales bacterium]|nr:non-ribosomal peptide synthetase [Candidatus Cacconaster merdequi]
MTSYEEILSGKICSNITAYQNNTAYIIKQSHISYGQMGSMARSIASALAAQIGASSPHPERPVRIGINLPRDSHYIPCIVASVMLHCSYVPIDVSLPQDRKDFIIKDSNLDFIITSDNLSSLIETEPVESLPDYRCSFSEVYMLFTSGTTGVPKGVSIPYSALCSYMETLTSDDFNFNPGSIVLQFASINFDISVHEIFGPLYYGSTIVVAQDEEKHDTVPLHDLIIREHITHALLPPSLLAIFTDFSFPDMISLSSGGEAIPQGVTKRLAGQYHFRFVNIYGPTESTVMVTTFHFKDDKRWQCIGKPLPGVVCYVVDENGNRVKPGETGELLIGGRQLANCYWNRPELNEKAFIKNPFEDPEGIAPRLYHSGDLVVLNEDGSFDYIGRMDSQVKLHSFRIELGEICSRIESHPRIRRALVRLEDFGNDKHIVAYASTSDGVEDLSDVKEYLRSYLPDYMVPTYWNHVTEFKLNVNGKIDKSQLINTAWQRYTAPNAGELKKDEQLMVSTIANVIGSESVNIDTDLVSELGLSSLQIMQTIADLNPIGMHLRPEDIYTYRTIRSIVKNHIYRVCFWFNDPEEHPEKPVLVIISGYTSFAFLYSTMATQLADRFNIFVIESYHTLLYFDPTPNPIIIELYKNMVRNVMKNYRIAAITGFCFGGEQALRVAYDLWNGPEVPYEEKPRVIVLDGELRRDKDRDHYISLNWPSLTDEQNAQRRLVDVTLLETIDDDFHYDGPVATIISDTFAQQQTITPEEQLTISEERMDFYRDYFERTPRYWKEEYPDCDLLFMPGDHFQALRTPESNNTIVNYILTHCLDNPDNKETA